VRLTLIGKPDCHLCHEMASVVRKVIGPEVELVEADVRSDPEWLRLYRREIPVLLAGDGRELARHRVDEPAFREILAGLNRS
jgi:hypothetical protein